MWGGWLRQINSFSRILGEVPNTQGTVHVYGRIACVSQTAWIQTGILQENILFGSPMDRNRYQDTVEGCSLEKDLELLPDGNLTEIGEQGVNLSGGQRQRIQLARALYQDADIYLLDDPFRAVDAQTATSLFNVRKKKIQKAILLWMYFCYQSSVRANTISRQEYVMEVLSTKTVLLVTHQVDFLPAFDSVLLTSDGEILRAAPYHQLLSSRKGFQDLVNAHKETAGSERLAAVTATPLQRQGSSEREIEKTYVEKQSIKR